MRALKQRNNIMKAPTSGIGTRNFAHLSLFCIPSATGIQDEGWEVRDETCKDKGGR